MGIGRTNASGMGGGSGGASLTVFAPQDVTVYAINEQLGKTHTRTTNYQGVVTFKGLESGTWKLNISDGNTSSTPVSVDIVSNYEVTLAFFTASITVTYPANSTCTCSNGDVTFTDINSTNYAKTVTFIISNKGVWSINCTDGERTANKNVEITYEGQDESVELVYHLVLFDGEDNASVTGGWGFHTNNSSTANIVDELIHLETKRSTTDNHAAAYTNNKIDIREYNALVVDISELQSDATAKNSFIGVTTSDISSYSYSMTAKTQFGSTTQSVSYTNQRAFLDVSNVDESAHVCVSANAYNAQGAKATFKISKVALYRETVAELGGNV